MEAKPIKTIKRYCPVCKEITDCMKDKDDIICLECLMIIPEEK